MYVMDNTTNKTSNHHLNSGFVKVILNIIMKIKDHIINVYVNVQPVLYD